MPCSHVHQVEARRSPTCFEVTSTAQVLPFPAIATLRQAYLNYVLASPVPPVASRPEVWTWKNLISVDGKEQIASCENRVTR